MRTTQPSSGGASSLSDLGVTTTASELNALHGVKRYVALLSQSGTDAPVGTVLENSLGGTVVWTRGSQGDYLGTLAGGFPAGKTVVQINPTFDIENGQVLYAYRNGDGAIEVTTWYIAADSTGSSGDGILGVVIGGEAYIIITVYP
jgi:hypothetical protein